MIHLPGGETHLQRMLRRGPLVGGRETYQFHKYRKAIRHVPRDRRRRAVDVGAHVGLWSRVMARDFSRVDAFEPVPEFQDCFRRNLEGAANVRLHSFALAAAPGALRMTVCDGNTGLSHVSRDGEQTVWAVALDSFGFDDVDFLKLDAEGYEVVVLEGALETLRRCRPVVIVEENSGKPGRYGRQDLAATKLLQREGARVVEDLSGDLVLTWN